MATLAQARVRWLAENPIASINPPVNQAAYDAMADDRATMILSQMNQEESDAARILLRKKYRAAKTELATAVTAGNAVTRLTNTRTIIDGLLDILKDANLVLDD